MRNPIRQLLTAVLLVSFVVADVVAASVNIHNALTEHVCHNAHHENPGTSEPAAPHSDCVCVACHTGCSHNAFVLQHTGVVVDQQFLKERLPSQENGRMPVRAAEIFIPPKLAA